ncbi:DUF6116 family protein [Microbulbifer sp. HZ11]|uniref:DUF6116 family protein n=1 Tax=unclassified Microbulbifer TaxID=2619833 RepID=UPI000A853430|nr:DUF6116 family protein [Microbulbifer sp. HZ11]
MKRVLPSAFVGWFLNYARKLKHPQLFKWICALFLIDLIIPDFVPFVDEILLGLGTIFLASWRKSREELRDPPERDEKIVKGSTEKATSQKSSAYTTSAENTKYGKH